MGILNGEGYGESIEERIQQVIDDVAPSKPGFSSVNSDARDRLRDSLRKEFGLDSDD